MNCKSVQQALSAYLDQELTGSEMLRIRSHVTRCAACTAEEESLRSLKHILSNAPTAVPAVGFEARLASCLKAEYVQEKRANIKLSTLALVSMAAAALTFLALPSVQQKPIEAPKAQPLVKSDAAFGIRADQAAFSGSDPLGGGRIILATDYGHR